MPSSRPRKERLFQIYRIFLTAILINATSMGHSLAQAPKLADSTSPVSSSKGLLRALELSFTCTNAEFVEPVGAKEKPEDMCEYVKFFAHAKIFGPDGKLLSEGGFCGSKHRKLLARKGTTGVLQIVGKGEYCVNIDAVPFYEHIIPNKKNWNIMEGMRGAADYGTFEFRTSWFYEISQDGRLSIQEPIVPGEHTKFHKVNRNNLATVKPMDFNLIPVAKNNRFLAALEFGSHPDKGDPVKVTASGKGMGVELPVEPAKSAKYFIVGPVVDLEIE